MSASLRAELEQSRPHLPEYVLAIVGRCLADPPHDAYGSADELKRAIEAALAVLEVETAETVVHTPLSAGRTALLHVEYAEASVPGSYRQYEIEERVSEGSYGDVFRAFDRQSGKTVALKVLKPRWIGNSSAVERFRREAQILARVVHPNVVRMMNFGRCGQSFFMAMEYLRGPTLLDVMRRACPMRPIDALELVLPILNGLAAVADAGVVHRDLKPANVKVTDGKVVVFDFGVSRAPDLETLTAAGEFVGTLKYAAPEQVGGQAVSTATDVYAAGVILYQMLTGRFPHEAAENAALMLHIATQPATPIVQLRSDLPAPLVNAIHTLLEPMPARRPAARRAVELLAAALPQHNARP